MRLKGYAGYIKNDKFKEVARIDLGKYQSDHGYVHDWYVYPAGLAVTLKTEHGDPLVEDRLGNNLRAIRADLILEAMQDDNDESEGTVYDWEMDVLEDERVTHLVLAVW